MPSAWIDFKELRAKLKFEDVLQHYPIVAGHDVFCPVESTAERRWVEK
jgi:hypothetical protein